MGPEIEKLNAAWQDACNATEAARRVEAGALDALDAALIEWAKADLQARGIVLGVTPVDGCRWMPREGQKPHYDRSHVAVVKVTSRIGQVRYLTQKLTKTGALSKALGSSGDTYVAVRKAGEA